VASALPYAPANQVPRELTAGEMAEIKADFVASAEARHGPGSTCWSLHCAHGYLLSSFISPRPTGAPTAYGGTLDGRLRFPLEVFDARTGVWPD